MTLSQDTDQVFVTKCSIHSRPRLDPCFLIANNPLQLNLATNKGKGFKEAIVVCLQLLLNLSV